MLIRIISAFILWLYWRFILGPEQTNHQREVKKMRELDDWQKEMDSQF